MHPTRFLRVEGLAVLAGGIGTYAWLDAPWWLFALLFLAPDVSMLAYLRGPRIGSLGYNVVHTYVGPIGLAALGSWLGSSLAVAGAVIWAAHIGADRLAGYGLKYESGFKPTHLQTQPVPHSALVESA